MVTASRAATSICLAMATLPGPYRPPTLSPARMTFSASAASDGRHEGAVHRAGPGVPVGAAAPPVARFTDGPGGLSHWLTRAPLILSSSEIKQRLSRLEPGSDKVTEALRIIKHRPHLLPPGKQARASSVKKVIGSLLQNPTFRQFNLDGRKRTQIQRIQILIKLS